MNRKLISKAFSDIDDIFIAESMFSPASNPDRAPERTTNMGKYESNKARVGHRRVFSLIMAACFVFVMAVTAYATNFMGIREMFQSMNQELPEAAEPYIQQHTETAAAEDWSARITESLCDESKIMVTVCISGGDQYIIAPTNADPDTLALNIGVEGDMTLGEYAKKQGKQLLFVGASLMENDSVGGNGSQHFEHVSDNEMYILTQADKTASFDENTLVCHVYAVDENWDKQTLDIPVTFTEAPSGESMIYVSEDSDVIPGITVGDAIIEKTPLGISIRYMETVTDLDAFYNVMKVEFDGLVYGEGSTVLEDDGNWYVTVSGCTGEVGDTLTVRYYDWDDQLIGTITFCRK